MKIIRDEECAGIMMIPLLVDWHIKRCNVKGCTEIPTTIISQAAPDVPVFGLCEQHFQQANVKGGTKFSLEFNDYDAFAEREKE